MIPYRGDQFDHYNHGQPVHRPMLLIPAQQAQIIQSPGHPSMIFNPQSGNYHHQPYPGNPPMQQPGPMFAANRPGLQQSWMITSAPLPPLPPPPPPPPPVTSMPTFVSHSPTTFHHVQPPFPHSQPSFSGGTGLPQSSYNLVSRISPPRIGGGTGIPQPAFSGGTAMFKRKSHYLDEADADPSSNFDNEFLSGPGMNSNQSHQHFRPHNPRYSDYNMIRVSHPSAPRLMNAQESYSNSIPNPPWMNNDSHRYPVPPQEPYPTSETARQQMVTSQLFQKHQLIPIDTILKEPGRTQRAAQILVVLRGLPGSGKSYVADLIKNEEELQSKGTNKPKILSIDDYFLTENQQEIKDPKTGKISKTSVMEYEYDPKMEETYRRSFIKSVRKSINDRFFPFLIVDQNNEQLAHFRDFVDYAEANHFQVYFIELTSEVELCAKRNIHKRSLNDIQQIHQRWESLPLRYEILDIRSMLQSDAIDEVEMDDASVTTTTTTNTPENDLEQDEAEAEEKEDSQITKKSKWEAMMETNPDRLDGLYQRRTHSSSPIEKRLNHTPMVLDETPTMESDSSETLQSKKKKVRWADIEETEVHLHKRAVGFVVGQSAEDWQRMSDQYDPTQKLNQYKYI